MHVYIYIYIYVYYVYMGGRACGVHELHSNLYRSGSIHVRGWQAGGIHQLHSNLFLGARVHAHLVASWQRSAALNIEIAMSAKAKYI